MKRLVLRTIAITLMSVLMVVAVVLGTLSAFSPLTLARFTETIGLNQVSIKYYERQYDKTKSQGDLAQLIYMLSEEGNAEACRKYCLIFITGATFADYCKTQGVETFGSEAVAIEYYCNKFVISTYNDLGFEHAFDEAKICVGKYGYTNYNSIRALFTEKGSELTAQQLGDLKNYVASITPQNGDTTKDIKDIDIIILQKGA